MATTAVLVPSGVYLEVAPGGTLAPSGDLANFFLVFWARIDSKPAQYRTDMVTMGGSGYLWLGSDYLVSAGDRNLAYFGPNGGHARDAYGDTGVYRHHAYSVRDNVLRGWLDGVPCDWDSSTSPHYSADLGSTSWNTTTLRLLNEGNGPGAENFIGGLRAVAIGRKTGAHLTDGDVLAAMARSTPFVTAGASDSGYSMLGSWPLATKNDLTNALTGGPALTLGGGALGDDTTGPSAIIIPSSAGGLSASVAAMRSRRRKR